MADAFGTALESLDGADKIHHVRRARCLSVLSPRVPLDRSPLILSSFLRSWRSRSIRYEVCLIDTAEGTAARAGPAHEPHRRSSLRTWPTPRQSDGVQEGHVEPRSLAGQDRGPRRTRRRRSRAYQNGVIRVDDYLVAVNGTVRRARARGRRACACTRANTLYTTRVTTRIPRPPPRPSSSPLSAPRALAIGKYA